MSEATLKEKATEEWVDIAKMMTLSGIDTELRNHSRMEALGDAQIRQHFGKDYSPDDDVGIQYNSPTTINHNYPAPQEQTESPVVSAPSPKRSLVGNALKAAALIGAGAAAPIVGPAVVDAIWPQPKPPVTQPVEQPVIPEFKDTDTVIGIGLGKADG
jgi:hypothetical protein